MNFCYTICDENFSYFKRNILNKFKNIAEFEIFFTQQDKDDFTNSNEKEFFLKLIEKFENLKAQNDFVIIKGCESFSVFGKNELNLKIAKNLNAPIFELKNLKALKSLNKNSKLLITDSIDEILASTQNIITPYKFAYDLAKRAKKFHKNVVLVESEDERILKAADILLKQDAVKITLLGDKNKIDKNALKLGLDLKKATIINPKQNNHSNDFADKIYELRKTKGISIEKAREMACDPTYFATMLVYEGLADAMVSGANTSSADTIRPALQIIKTKPDTKLVSSVFFMAMDEEIFAFADCAITPNPNEEELASIVVSTAKSAISFGIEPRIAMLSYSTANSGSGKDVEFVKEAARIALELDPSLKIAAPIQYDAAIDMDVAAKKMPNSDVAGQANVFIFPNLNCGNICYKAVQRSANAVAMGPVLQGLNKPVNDLSRGCLVEDIVNTVLISAIQAGE
ncbi:phosphate acetyltransferase [Campylobacter sp. RM13119]|uniref:phosphate acetyltransferase n=1 Tax=Campylobacter californiensis TaxID=1032243 RepID=UPI001472B06D|nr:phosphate acetyltransferase [Campylobacter sp. RM13119]MBE3606869.1 phosphate acetyltransferase [Campylobacter sp. RM13119]